MQTKKSTCHVITLEALKRKFDEIMLGEKRAKGFSIGKGKKIYWYITANKYLNKYRCLPIEQDGELGWPRWCSLNQKVVVRY